MTTADVVPIKYIGKKPYRPDNVNHTRTLWLTGQTLPYPKHLAASLLRHPDIWALGDAADMPETLAQDAEGIVTAPPERSAMQASATKDIDRGMSLRAEVNAGPDPAPRPGSRMLE